MEKKYLEIKRQKVFTKFINFIKKFFYKEYKILYTENIKAEMTKEKDSKLEFLEGLRNENENDQELIKLQNQFESSGKELQSFSDEEIQNLIILYKKQITDLSKKMINKKTELKELRFRISSYSSNN